MKPWSIGIGALALIAAPLAAATQIRPVDFTRVLIDGARPSADLMRDEDRKPADLLAFAEVRPGIKVVELAPGGGYFTRLLSLAAGSGGKIYAVSSRPLPWLEAWTQAHPNVVHRSGPIADPLAPENLLKSSGRGIFFMRSFMDDVSLRRGEEGGMEVRMVKKLSSGA